MGCQIRQFFSRLLLIGAIVLAILLALGLWHPAMATAAIRQLEEAPGQIVYQARQTLHDQHRSSWQTIAFKRVRADGNTSFALRLVGFPGGVDIDRSQPLTITTSLGKTLTATDASSDLFTAAATPEPNVGQYDLQPLLPQLQAEIPLNLSLPTLQGEAIRLVVPPSLVEEWQTVSNSGDR
jgi:Protein of unknown function (DUF3122)